MPVLTLTIEIPDVATLLTAGYEKVKVYRASTLTGSYVEVSTTSTRPTLASGKTIYESVDYTGNPFKFYRWAPFNDPAGPEGDQVAVTPLYVSVADLRAEGILVGVASDAKLVSLIRTWTEFVEAATKGNFFLPRTTTLILDGNGSKLLPLPHPVVSVSAIHINGSTTDLDADLWCAYPSNRNPRVRIVSSEVSIFAGTGVVGRTTDVFAVGERNQQVDGTFGWVDANGFPPEAIRYVVRKLVSRSASPLFGTSSPGGPLIEEETDRHRRRWADPLSTVGAWSVSQDAEVDQILAMHRAPISVRSPRSTYKRLVSNGDM